MYTIATLFQFKRHLGVPNTTTSQDDRLLATLEAAAQHMEHVTGRRFVPYEAALTHDVDPLFPSDLILRDDLLQLYSATDAEGSINTDDLTMLPPQRAASLLRLNGVYAWDDTTEEAVTVTGVWGWHNAPLDVWQSTGDIVFDVTLSSTATTMTVTDADAVYADGITPRFSVGALLNVESEFMRVLAVDVDANTLTVERGVQGTTAAAQIQGTPILVYRPPYDVLMATLRLAAWYYRQADTSTPLPLDVFHTLTGLRRMAVRA